MRVNRKFDLKTDRISEEEPIRLTMAEALSFVWELTEEIFSLSGKYDVKSRLQRNVVAIARKQS